MKKVNINLNYHPMKTQACVRNSGRDTSNEYHSSRSVVIIIL